MATGENIGMMEGAFFVGRKAILDWLNSLLKLNLQKIEQTCSGAVACQLCDALYGPDSKKVPMHKLKWDCKSDHEYTQNYKILQDVFRKVGVNKVIPVAQLVRGKYQDNLEFMQWFKRFFELNSSQEVDQYDAISRRSKGRGVEQFERMMTSETAKLRGKSSLGRISGGQRRKCVPAKKGVAVEDSETLRRKNEVPTGTQAITGKENMNSVRPYGNTVTQEKFLQLVNEKRALASTASDLEKERDFYFGKLRDIEIYLQNLTEDDGTLPSATPDVKLLADSIFKILYATGENFSPATTSSGIKDEARVME
jgi:microtubule-associated protein, RP/EB family